MPGQPPPYSPPHARAIAFDAAPLLPSPLAGKRSVWGRVPTARFYSGTAVTSMAFPPDTRVKRNRAPVALTPEGTPSRSNANHRRPGGAPGIGSGSGNAQSSVGPSANRSRGVVAGAVTSTTTRG